MRVCEEIPARSEDVTGYEEIFSQMLSWAGIAFQRFLACVRRCILIPDLWPLTSGFIG